MTTLRDLTADEINTLAAIIAKLRPHGSRRWDTAGVRAALARVANYDAATALMAAIRLSQDRSAETPGQIAITSSECWREKPSDWSPPVSRDICPVHGITKSATGICSGCRSDELGTVHALPTRPPKPRSENVNEVLGQLHEHLAKTRRA